MAELLYVRNARPNILIVKFAGAKFPLERRGNREDSVALPVDAKNDPIVGRFIRQGFLEEISKEAFMELGLRTEDKPYALRTGTTLEKDLPMNDPFNPQPTLISNKDITETAHLRSPNPEFAGKIPSTDEELGFVKPELDPAQIDEIKSLQAQIEELKAQVAASNQPEALSEVEEKKPVPRTRTKKVSS